MRFFVARLNPKFVFEHQIKQHECIKHLINFIYSIIVYFVSITKSII
jgi:hypothetical protein